MEGRIPFGQAGQRWRNWRRAVSTLFIVFGVTGGAALAYAQASDPAASRYRVIRLSADPGARAIINDSGQVAFSVEREGRSRARFFDGRRIVDFGTLGGTSAVVADLNDAGQIAFNVVRNGNPRAVFYDGRRTRVLGTLGGPGATVAALNDAGQAAGTSSVAASGAAARPYRWSRASGMVGLGAAGQGDAVVIDINASGQVVGRASFAGAEGLETHGFFWSPQTGLRDIGALGEFSVPTAMNDGGTIVGYGGRGPSNILAFRWTRPAGLNDLGSLPNEFTWATHINRAGQVVGATPFVADGQARPFLWTPGRGLLDLGVGGASRGAGTEVNGRGMVIGYLFRDFILSHGFIWTRETGLIEIGAGSPTLATAANDVNERGQVVGSSGARAMIWTRGQGFIDLNTLATAEPAHPVLNSANAISESGAILATANTGLYLLVPVGRPGRP